MRRAVEQNSMSNYGVCFYQSIVENRELSSSFAVREFLAYDCDPTIAFVRKPSDVQRIDQVEYLLKDEFV